MLMLLVSRLHFEHRWSKWYSACLVSFWKETADLALHNFLCEVGPGKGRRNGLWEADFVYSFGKRTALMPCIFSCWEILPLRGPPRLAFQNLFCFKEPSEFRREKREQWERTPVTDTGGGCRCDQMSSIKSPTLPTPRYRSWHIGST